MGFFDFLSGGNKEPVKRERKYTKRSYAAASTSRLFSDFDQSERSADSEIKPKLRILRARSRSLARDNEYVKAYLDLLKTNVVGDMGFSLQVKAQDSTGKLDQIGNQEIETAWYKWCRRGNCSVDGIKSFIDLQKLVVTAVARDGECIIIKHRGSGFHNSFALQILESDQLDLEKSERLPGGNEVRMGVELDKFKKPIAYYFLNYHPGDYDFTSQSVSKKHTRVLAENVIHIYDPQRAGQTRGEPWTTSAIAAIKHLGAFREAAVINARIGASKMGFFTSPAGDGYAADDVEENVPTMEVEPGIFQQLPKGMEFSSFDPTYPNNEFHGFHKSVLKGVASGLGVSYTALSNDLEATSYSSIRQGSLIERDTYRSIQRFMIDHFVMVVYKSWLESAMEMGYLNLPIRTFDKFYDASGFRGRSWNWIDPVKEMSAAVTGLANGVLSLQDVAAQYGKDADELLSELQRDKALAKQFGIKYAFEPFGAKMTPIPPEIAGDIADE
jgi:lambda family phage portal protein